MHRGTIHPMKSATANSAPAKHPGALRRTLTLRSLEDLERELDAIEQADRAGTLRSHGNWSPGKILGHLASWIDYAYDGFPSLPPAWARPIFRLMKGVFLKDRPMKPGMRIPGTTEGTHGVVEMDVKEGLIRLRAAIERLRVKIPDRHPLFGVLTRSEWERMHLNHSALHLGFLTLDS
jgi:hypothetical protein